MPRDKELKVITGQAGRKDKNAEKMRTIKNGIKNSLLKNAIA
jgi:hypothetical protein